MGDWRAIAHFVGNSRTKSQCRQRWTRGLDPNINKTKWTPEQDSRLLMIVQIFGSKSWSKVSGELGNRCDVQCRYRYKQLIKDPQFPVLEAKAAQAAREFVKTSDMRQAVRARKLSRSAPQLPALQARPEFMPVRPITQFSPFQSQPLPVMMLPQGAHGAPMAPEYPSGQLIMPQNPRLS
jgi:hypothetical protein